MVNPDPSTPGAGGAIRRAARSLLTRARTAARAVADGAASAWAHRPPPDRGTAILFLAAVATAGIFAMTFQARLAGRLPSALDWAAARALLERDARPGDAVALAPAWAERAREVLPASTPIVPALGASEDLDGVRRIWLVSLPDTPAFSFQAELALLERGAQADLRERLGELRVARHVLAAPTLPLAFLPDRLAGAEVTLGGAACEPVAGGFRCPGPGAPAVVRTVREVAGVPRPCLAIDLAGGAGPLAVAFPGVPAGRAVRGHIGAAGPRAAPGTLARVSVLLDGDEAGAAELPLDRFAPFEVETARFAGRFRTVSLVVSAARDPGVLCLDAVVLP